jgi:hypothetical protein
MAKGNKRRPTGLSYTPRLQNEGKHVVSIKDRDYKNELDFFTDNAYLGLDEQEMREILYSPDNFLKAAIDFKGDPGRDLLRLFRRPDHFPMFAKYIFNINLYPFQGLFLKTLYEHPFPLMIACRGGSKTFTIALYVMIMCTLYQGTKCIMVGTGFRQSRLIFEYMEKIWQNSPILVRDLIGDWDGSGIVKHNDRWTMRIGNSEANAIPLGADGKKVRGFRANIIIADEFQSQNPTVYEEVIQGFGSTAQDPFDKAKISASRRYLKEKKLWTPQHEENYLDGDRPNQSIIVGTADYDFGHFAKYFRKYRDIIESKGDTHILSKHTSDEGMLPDWKKYAILRIPYDLFPESFMDKDNIARAKSMLPKGLFFSEYGGVFSKDSDGFFPMSIIRKCTTSDPIQKQGGPVQFTAQLAGNIHGKYVFGIDPAANQDNFAIVIIEWHPDHRRVVFCWTTNKDDYKKRQSKGLVKEHDYFSYVTRKIRDLMRVFPPEYIAVDAQGGGIGLYESFQDPEKMKDDEQPLLEVPAGHILSTGFDSDTDMKGGLHIVQMCQPGNFDWLYEANIGLKKDMEDQIILFPYMDEVELQVAFEMDNAAKREFDTLEQCALDIEELKAELATIQMSPTQGGNRFRWDTPEVKIGNKKGRMHKDRYSALLMANAAARKIQRFDTPKAEMTVGGWKGQIAKHEGQKMFHAAPDWFRKAYEGR